MSNKTRYVIEWRIGFYEEVRDDVYDIVWGDFTSEIFIDECDFNQRVSDLRANNNMHEIEINTYTCELIWIDR